MFSEIAEIKSIREQKSRLWERERELTKPMLSDLSIIPQIYSWFCEIQGDRNCSGRNESAHVRKKFIFIILFLYAPGVLAGGRTPIGLRDAIAEAINLKDVTFISHNAKTVVFTYYRYKDFRQDVNRTYLEILKRIKPGS